MIKFLRKLFRRIIRKEVVHFMPHLPLVSEVSDGDKATLYGWPDKTVEEVMRYE